MTMNTPPSTRLIFSILAGGSVRLGFQPWDICHADLGEIR